MNKKEIKKQIEDEKTQLQAYLKLAEKFKLPEDEIEKQINFYLEKIAELIKKLNQSSN